jgi:hypothetical protein
VDAWRELGITPGGMYTGRQAPVRAKVNRLMGTAFRILLVTMANVLVQAVLLLVSLLSLATEKNLLPPLIPAILAAVGILLLGGTVTWTVIVRGRLTTTLMRANDDDVGKGVP